MTVANASWPLIGGLYRSPALEALGLVAGSTSAALGSMAGDVYPHDEQERNRGTVARALGFDGVVRAKQVHGDVVLRADAPFGAPWPEADALWTDRRGILLGVAAADCVPILIAEPRRAGDDAARIGVAHAGWEGTSKRVAQALVRTLAQNGASAPRLVASIGPSIGPCCYTIDERRADAIRERLGADAADALRTDGDGRIVFDLWSANATQLQAAGVREVELAGLCTRCGPADLWSYRARGERGPQGTGMAVLGWPR